jgi:hypothetical protein
MPVHEADNQLAGAVESTLRWAAANAMVADADFATDQATTLANIATRNAAIHVTLQPFLEMIYAAVKLGFRVLGATTMIADLATIYAACPGGNWQPGFSAAL